MKSLQKIIIVVVLLFMASNISYGQNNVIHWMKITDAYQKSLTDTVKKKVFIDIYTQWCGWCKRMDASTYEDPTVIDYINAHFYPVKLDAEIRDTINLGDKTYVYRTDFKANEVAVALLNQKMSYPTSIFLDEGFNMLSPLAGFQTTEQLFPVLRYFGENIYKTTNWEDYQNQGYRATTPQTQH